MATAIDEVATFLAAQSLGTVGTNIFKGLLPLTPDVCLAIFEYPGLSPDHVFGSETISVEYPRLQIVVRGSAYDYDGPRARAQTAYEALAGVINETLSSTRYLEIIPLQPPFLLRRDATNRVEIAFNVQVSKALS